MKLILDQMLDAIIAEQLKRRGHDIEAVQGHGDLEGKNDPDLLRAALELDRVVVTDNVQDFARLHQQFLAAGEAHAGILLVSPARYPRAKGTIRMWVDGLDAYLRGHRGTSVDSQLDWLP